MLLLFAAGRRPDIAALQSAESARSGFTISHAPDRGETGECCAELLVDGLTFDLLGLAPGPPFEAGRSRAYHDKPGKTAPDGAEALLLRPGPHLASGAHMLSVVRGFAVLALYLSEALHGIVAIVWQPTNVLVTPEFFHSSVVHWVGGGALPVFLRP